MDQVRQKFGDAFTAYCLNTSVDSLDSGELTERQLEVIGILAPFAETVSSDPSDLNRPIMLGKVLEYDDASKTSIANMMRMHCGGSLAVVDSADPAEKALLTLGRDMYAACLLPEHAEPMMNQPLMSIPVFRHPKAKEAAQAILADPSLKKLFPGGPDPENYGGDGIDVHSWLSWSNGAGGTFQLVMLVSSFLSIGLNRLSATSTVDEYFGVIRQLLTTSRSLANKRNTPVPVLIGLSNIQLSESKAISFAGGKLRLPTAGDRRTLMNADNVTVVLEVEAHLKLLSIRRWEQGAGADSSIGEDWERNRPVLNRFQQELRRNTDLARLVMLFSSSGDNIIAPVEMATAVINPLAAGQSVAGISPFLHPVAAFGASSISLEAGMKIQEWAPKIANHPGSLDMAMRRLLSSVSTRLDPMDGFVDAVICWENMFGTGEGEVSFRVSGAIAKLLEPDDARARKELFDEVKSLYGIRSKLVHGSKEPEYQDAVDQRKRSVEIAIQALQRLYELPDVLNAENSSVRGRMLLLGA
ncbi:hypothetical protein ACIO53_37705 [Streptomyces sp. NPDC087305]|uniref:hypothetical protein n=1 Tax=Streptomyces sp. NPDC087305 TaxID=3365781 RepID=UPI0037F8CA12